MAEPEILRFCIPARVELEQSLVPAPYPSTWLWLGGVNQMLWDAGGRCHAGHW